MSSHRRKGRRGSAVGLLNVDDDAVYGDNANKYGKKKGSLLSRVKKNVGQKIEGAAKTTKTSLTGGVQMLVSKSGHYSAEHDPDSDEWESDADFESNDSFDDDQNFADDQDQNSSFDQSLDAFGDSSGQFKKLDVSQHSFCDDDGSEQFVVRSTVKSLGIKARSDEGSKAKAERRRSKSLDKNEISDEKRKSNDNLLSRRLEDKNLTKIKYGDDPSIIQFSPWAQQPAPPKSEFQSEPFSVASTEKEEKAFDPFSKSEEFALSVDDSGTKKKKDKTRKKVRRTNSMPSEKVMRRAQRRSIESGLATDDQNVGRSTRNPRRHRRTKSSDDAPLLDVETLVDTMNEKKSKKKRGSRSPKRTNNSSSHSRALSTSGHSTGLNSSSHHSKPRKSKGEASNRKSANAPTEITPSTLDVRF